MKQWTQLLILTVATLAITFVACDSDSDDGGSTTDTSVATDTSTATDTTDTNTTTVVDQCLGTDDLARIQDTNQTDPSTIAADCGTKACITQALSGDFEAAATCSNDCMVNGNADNNITAAGLSAGCTSCYIDAVLCGAKYCLSKCAADAASAPCVSCRAGDNDAGVDCTGNFYTCSGLPQN